MKNILLRAFALALLQACSTSDSIFVLSPAQSMSITGKGVGQDAAYNPYAYGKSLARIKNLGESSFNIRIQKNGKVIENHLIKPNEKREFVLLKGYELYLDSKLQAKARVDFKKFGA